MAEQKTQSAKNRKYERAARSPSMVRYKAILRDLINKTRKVAKYEAAFGKVLTVPRGTARKNHRLFAGITLI